MVMLQCVLDFLHCQEGVGEFGESTARADEERGGEKISFIERYERFLVRARYLRRRGHLSESLEGIVKKPVEQNTSS